MTVTGWLCQASAPARRGSNDYEDEFDDDIPPTPTHKDMAPTPTHEDKPAEKEAQPARPAEKKEAVKVGGKKEEEQEEEEGGYGEEDDFEADDDGDR